MKLLLLVILLTAGATTFRISPQAGWHFGSLFWCDIHLLFPSTGPSYYGCYCDFFSRATQVEKRCCQTRDNCYSQFKKLESCKSFLDKPYGSSYSYLCSGNEVTCSEEKNTCEDLICNYDCQAAICFSKQDRGIQC